MTYPDDDQITPRTTADGPRAVSIEDLRRAITGADIDTVYQPIVDTVRGTIVGYEALTRFPGFAQQNPEVWFKSARMRGLGPALESTALRRALSNRALLPTNCFLTLNVSPEFLQMDAVQEGWILTIVATLSGSVGVYEPSKALSRGVVVEDGSRSVIECCGDDGQFFG